MGIGSVEEEQVEALMASIDRMTEKWIKLIVADLRDHRKNPQGTTDKVRQWVTEIFQEEIREAQKVMLTIERKEISNV